MKPDEWAELIEKMGGQKIDIPPDQIETFQEFVNEWHDAHAAFNAVSHRIRVTQQKMHNYVELVLPQLEGWEYRIDVVKNQVVLTFPKDKE